MHWTQHFAFGDSPIATQKANSVTANVDVVLYQCPQPKHCGIHRCATLPKGAARLAWVKHFMHHFAPKRMTGFVLAYRNMSFNRPRKGTIRRALIEVDLMDCMVALPGQLFYSTQILVCLWFLAKNKPGNKSSRAGLCGENEPSLAA